MALMKKTYQLLVLQAILISISMGALVKLDNKPYDVLVNSPKELVTQSPCEPKLADPVHETDGRCQTLTARKCNDARGFCLEPRHHGYFDVIPEGPRKTVTQPPLFTTPQQSSSSIQTIRIHRVSQILSPTAQPPTSDFPPQYLVKNLGRFMRYSSAAYGQQFLRIMGIGVDSHVGLTVDQILLSSFTEPNPVLGNEVLSPLVHYVSIDHDSKAIVLTCRGTLGLSDILVDLTCEYEPIAVDGGDPNASYPTHSGMLHSALRLRRESSTVHEVIKQALIDYSNYGLIITGHSLGGGVAALLAVLCSTRTETFLEQIDR
ncbi:hypothetical protein KEM48_007122 [Puccinia striiformis f. sp. tritici PST-130]|nr:hypothetical protein KEM48_007122 [Puccinia striiformis f. sp. tritici PST-130]